MATGNLTPTWEVTPSVARTMNFSFVVRDNNAGGGQTAADLMIVTVADITPFTVSAPNTAVTWSIGSTQTVTWNVGSTNTAPVNCANVNIKLSTDGGLTYPVTILANTPNDGTQSITVPNNPGTTCRIMVEAADNIFYDISDTNFTISVPSTVMAGTPSSISVPSSDSDGTYTVSWGTSSTSGVTYVLEEATNSGFTGGLRTAYSGTGTSTNITGRSNGVTYYYRVKATKSGYNNSAWKTDQTGVL